MSYKTQRNGAKPEKEDAYMTFVSDSNHGYCAAHL